MPAVAPAVLGHALGRALTPVLDAALASTAGAACENESGPVVGYTRLAVFTLHIRYALSPEVDLGPGPVTHRW
jgi:hypothetical protein